VTFLEKIRSDRGIVYGNFFLERWFTMKGRLSARETRLAQTLSDGLDLFEAVRFLREAGKGKRLKKPQGIRGNRYYRAVQSLRELAEEEGIPIAVIGGVAAVFHGYERFTQDLDIVVSVQDFHKIIKVCYKYGFEIESYNPTGMHEISYNGLPIEVLEEGMFAGDPKDPIAMPSPTELGVTQGLEFVPLEKWVRLKLSGKRSQDYTDIINVFKSKTSEEHQDTEDYLRDFNPEYAQKFRELAETAQLEKERQKSFFPKKS
jgi:hypothetical protein